MPVPLHGQPITHGCESFPLFLACSITSGSSPWCCLMPVFLVPRALSSAFEGTMPLSRPSGNVSRVLASCRLHSLAAAVSTACKHGPSGLCLWPLVTAQWCIHRNDNGLEHIVAPSLVGDNTAARRQQLATQARLRHPRQSPTGRHGPPTTDDNNPESPGARVVST